jgi:hypothetical protein
MRMLLPLVLLVAGCAGQTHSSVGFGSVSTHGSVHAHVSGGSALAAVLAASILAAGVIEHERERAELTAPSAAMDAGRRVSEQDCTKPIDYSLGNIRCK